ncbi:MAG: hypothetical protein GKR87_09820 [Kiritimatiellae bacterium]|nr:hypothetical protein [Kiritimatiellia bacterium]
MTIIFRRTLPVSVQAPLLWAEIWMVKIGLMEGLRIPELLNEVHRLIEHKRYSFFLTGSSARNENFAKNQVTYWPATQ